MLKVEKNELNAKMRKMVAKCSTRLIKAGNSNKKNC